MHLTFRWFGPDDRVTLANVRQVPGVEGIVTALHDVPAGETWTKSGLAKLGEQITAAGLRFAVIESIPVHEDIKLGKPTRDKLIEHYCESVRAVGESGIPVVCYNFMPVFDWMRTVLDLPMEDGSTTLAYSHEELLKMDLSRGIEKRTAWASGYTAEELQRLFAEYAKVPPEKLWENLAYFLERVVPAAAASKVTMALHPDDPPWPIFSLPRVIVDGPALERVTKIVDSPANGITFCTGSLGALPSNDLPAMIRRLGKRIAFAHCRNVHVCGDKVFREVAHPAGDVDMAEVMKAYRDVGFTGPMRPDHGRMIWGETGRPGYGLYDRALGAAYLKGLWDAVSPRASRK